jgi:hypothetical protein
MDVTGLGFGHEFRLSKEKVGNGAVRGDFPNRSFPVPKVSAFS